jgi:hypothetical protein
LWISISTTRLAPAIAANRVHADLGNTGGDWKIVDAPAFKELHSEANGTQQSSNGGGMATSVAGAND